MFDLGWQEFILIALVAVIVVGPKDLPRVVRTVGQWIRKARSLASEFQGSLEEMARESELDDVRKSIQEASRGGVGASIEKHVDPDGEIRRSFEEARDSSGAAEIEQAVDEARRDTKALATADEPRSQDSPAAPAVEPKPAAGAKPAAEAPAKRAAAKTTSAKSPTSKSAAARSTASKAPAKAATTKAAAAAPAAAKSTAPAKPAAAKPKRATRRPATGPAGEA
ncbi:MAG: Sec-independent protein translocase protein TatB [Thalassobaculum sp.]|uniref:Sec-independent protein translocase protein TatB n=1 Tax=Thalassobaculum sp. TaxID=2022740 RepID=UPI0032EE78BA